MRKSIFERAKTHMAESHAANLHGICCDSKLVPFALAAYVTRLLDVLDEQVAVIDQRNVEIKNLHSDATTLRGRLCDKAEVVTVRNDEIATLQAALQQSNDRNLDKQKQITGLCREVAALKHDLAARANDDKLKADIGDNALLRAAMPVNVAHDEMQYSPFPGDFYIWHDGKFVGINAKYVILNTAPGGAMLTEAVVSQAEISVLDKTIHNKVCAALETATQPGGVIFAALKK